MRDSEIPTYIANVVYAALRDARFSSHEVAALEEIRARLGAKRTQVAEGTKTARTAGFLPIPVGTLGDRVRNLEDMVFVALADSELVDNEREVIVAFSEQVGITQEQLDQIVTEAQVRCSELELRSSAAQGEHDAGRGQSVAEESDPARKSPAQTAIARRACQHTLHDCREAGIRHVELLVARTDDECCDMAISLQGAPVAIDQVPALPLAGCTAQRCQCVWIASG